MIWILILGELGVFGVLLVGLSVARAMDPAVFATAQEQLHPLLAALNTFVLLTSGFLVAWAVELKRAGRPCGWQIGLALALGVLFLTIKGSEYAALFQAGIGIETNTFFQLYFLITGFHALHIVFGVVLLGIVARCDGAENLETGAAFWHLLDVLWVLIFPVVYLLR